MLCLCNCSHYYIPCCVCATAVISTSHVVFVQLQSLVHPMLCLVFVQLQSLLHPMLCLCNCSHYYIPCCVCATAVIITSHVVFVQLQSLLHPMLCLVFVQLQSLLHPMLCLVFVQLQSLLHPMLCLVFVQLQSLLQSSRCHCAASVFMQVPSSHVVFATASHVLYTCKNSHYYCIWC